MVSLRHIVVSCCLLGFYSYASTANWEAEVKELTSKHNFIWGVATSAYQIEGAWDQDGKGESIWDDYTHNYPYRIADRSNGNIACDSYNNLERDIRMISELNVDYYRLSISWSRILPNGGLHDRINMGGIQYYRKVFDALIARNITPIVTIYHWDLPLSLHYLGGWHNELIVDYFEKYARILFHYFGDKIKMWITINEPYHICSMGYGDVSYPPEHYVPGVSSYLCMHNLLKAHARAYHLYDKEFRPKQNGIVGFVNSLIFHVPYSDKQEDIDAAARGNLHIGWSLNPIFSSTGDYPELLKETVATVSKLQGLKKSRLPEFTREEVAYIKGTADFLGVNYYTSRLAKHDKFPTRLDTTFIEDMGVTLHVKPDWEQTSTNWLLITPDGLRAGFRYLKEHYNNPLIIITEIGCTGAEEADVEQVIKYYKLHINVVHDAVTVDGVNIRGFLAWSLMDSFEWDTGYTVPFGLYSTNFSDPKRSTQIKKVGQFYQVLNGIAKSSRKETGISIPQPLDLLKPVDSSAAPTLKSTLFLMFNIFLIFQLLF